VEQRRKNLQKNCKKLGSDVLVTFEPENLYYMTGFWGEAIGVLEGGNATIIAPALEIDRARAESVDCTIIQSERGMRMFSSLITKISGKKVCTDCQNYSIMQSMKKSIPCPVECIKYFAYFFSLI